MKYDRWGNGYYGALLNFFGENLNKFREKKKKTEVVEPKLQTPHPI